MSFSRWVSDLVPGLALVALSQGALGCGHPATREECEEIMRVNATIELKAQNITDPAVVKTKLDDLKAIRGDEILGLCVGKRITTDALACVKRAQKSSDVDACLD